MQEKDAFQVGLFYILMTNSLLFQNKGWVKQPDIKEWDV